MKRKKIPAKIRKLVYGFYDRKCLLCGLDYYLQIHHRDKNPENNNIENLELRCVWCHTLEHEEKRDEMIEWAFGMR